MNRLGNFMKCLVVGFIVAMLMAGCGQGPYGIERKWSLGMGDVPNRIGTEQPQRDGHFPSLWQLDDLPDKAGLAKPTGTWFFDNGAGRLGYGLTTGVKPAGDELAVTLFAHEEGGVQMDRLIRIRLISRTPDLAMQEEIFREEIRVGTVQGEKRIYTGSLPGAQNRLYTFSAEVLDEAGRVEDARNTLIYVPAPELNVTLQTDQTRYGKGDRDGKWVLANEGPTVLLLGKDYRIEKRVEDAWRIVPIEVAVPDIALYLLPGQSHEESFDVSRLDAGHYRVVKTFRADGFPELTGVLAAEFEVFRP